MSGLNAQSHHIIVSFSNIIQSLSVLQICRKYKVLDAVAYLLEKSGDVQGAFQILLEVGSSDYHIYFTDLDQVLDSV